MLIPARTGKSWPRSWNYICSKEVDDTILENSSAKDYSKTEDSVQNTGIVNRSGSYENSGQSSHKKGRISCPRSMPEQYSPGVKEGWGKSSIYKLKSTQQSYSIQAL